MPVNKLLNILFGTVFLNCYLCSCLEYERKHTATGKNDIRFFSCGEGLGMKSRDAEICLVFFFAAVLADCVTWLESAGMWEDQVTWSPWWEVEAVTQSWSRARWPLFFRTALCFDFPSSLGSVCTASQFRASLFFPFPFFKSDSF